MAPPPGLGYRLVFEDRFDVDTGLWVNQPWYTRPPSDLVRIGDGRLVLRMPDGHPGPPVEVCSLGPDTGPPRRYLSPAVFEQGYFECRMRYTATGWISAAFWLFGAERAITHPVKPCEVGYKLHSEWDIAEPFLDRPDRFHSAVHFNTGNDCNAGHTHRDFIKDMGFDLHTWHDYGGLWDGDRLITYIDGQVVGELAAYDTMAQPHYLILSVSYRRGVTPPGPKPPEVEMEVDWVRVWQPAELLEVHDVGMGYDQLRSIVDENAEFQRAEASNPPAACPNDGEPLEEGPDGQLHCPWDGYVWAG